MASHSRHSRHSSSSSSGEDDNKIEYIGGKHHSGEKYLALKWEVYYFGSYGLSRNALKNLLEDRLGSTGYALSLIGVSTYQLWTPIKLTPADFDQCKDTSSQTSDKGSDETSDNTSNEKSEKSSNNNSDK
ncbi:hypothetical protein VMCG_04840 [Cytospora schulzeri]|uniref:Uncharacterized protein n=1 Tax=Cytospora schulzeri TaxID=448051 RepID=A0A423WNA8_9PEZI|nr:hypothetical protein VMCG_04840 [Valsa malicola]